MHRCGQGAVRLVGWEVGWCEVLLLVCVSVSVGYETAQSKCGGSAKERTEGAIARRVGTDQYAQVCVLLFSLRCALRSTV